MATNFIHRWSKRKLESELEQDCVPPIAESPSSPEPLIPEQTVETQASDTSVASLLASQAEAAVKKAALRQLFLSGEFSEIDGLNDYDHDYKAVKSLSSEVAEKLRDWMNTEEEPLTDMPPPLDHGNDDVATDSTCDAAVQDSLETVANDDGAVLVVGQNIPHKK